VFYISLDLPCIKRNAYQSVHNYSDANLKSHDVLNLHINTSAHRKLSKLNASFKVIEITEGCFTV